MRIGELLVQDGAISAADLDAALRTQAQYGGRLASTLIDLGYLDLDVAARALGKQLDVPVALRRHFDAVEPRAVQLLTRKAAEHYRCMPLGFSNRRARTLVVALVDPRDPRALQELPMVSGMRVLASVAPEIRIHAALAKFYGVAVKPMRSTRGMVRVDPAAPPEIERRAPSAPPAQRPPVSSKPPPRALELDVPVESGGRSLPPLRAQALESALPPAGASIPPPVELAPLPAHEPPALDDLLSPLELPAPPPTAERVSPLPPMREPPPPPAAFGDRDRDGDGDEADVHDTAPSSPAAKRASTAPSMPASRPPGSIERSAPPPRRSARPPIAEEDGPVRDPRDARSDPDDLRRTSVERSRPPDRSERPQALSSRPTSSPSLRASPTDLVSNTVAALDGATDPDTVAAALVDYLRGAFGVGVVFVARNDVAVGWRGCAPAVGAASIASIAVPLTQPSILATAYESGQIFRGSPPREGEPAHRRIWTALRTPPPASAIAIPLLGGHGVGHVVYAHALDGAAPSSTLLRDVTLVCAAAQRALLRVPGGSRTTSE